jgi:glycosyltransferase involved in cell wall biosynthesis
MKILFIHPNIPGQYKHLARILGEDSANQVVFITKPRAVTIPGVTKIEYKVTRDPKPEIHRYIIGFERAIFHGQEVWRVCKELKEQGFTPDIICAHPGWGDALFVKDIFPQTPLLNFMEFYYHAFGADVYFDKNETVIPDDVARIRVKNSTNLLNLEACDWGVSPTWWQFKQHPKEYHHKISVIHDGIDTDVVAPALRQKLILPDGTTLPPNAKIVTYVCRNFEPYRGFPTVMRGIEKLTRERSDCHVLIVGNDGVSYGKTPDGKKTYKQAMLDELTLDTSRVHFIDALPYEQYLKILQYSDAHIYFTVPFVLSWSSMEAMSAGCLVIGSDTAPVREVIQDGVNGLLTDFFSPDQLAQRLHEALDNPEKMKPIRKAARQTIIYHYSLKKLMPLHIALITDLANKQMPPSAAQRIKDFNREIEFPATEAVTL